MVEEESLKLYYSIGEVAEMFGVNTSLIRFWEKEFDVIKPSQKQEREPPIHKSGYRQLSPHLSPSERKRDDFERSTATIEEFVKKKRNFTSKS